MHKSGGPGRARARDWGVRGAAAGPARARARAHRRVHQRLQVLRERHRASSEVTPLRVLEDRDHRLLPPRLRGAEQAGVLAEDEPLPTARSGGPGRWSNVCGRPVRSGGRADLIELQREEVGDVVRWLDAGLRVVPEDGPRVREALLRCGGRAASVRARRVWTTVRRACSSARTAASCLSAPGKLPTTTLGLKEAHACAPTRTRAPRGSSFSPRNSDSVFFAYRGVASASSSSGGGCRTDGSTTPRSDLMASLAQASTMLARSTLLTCLLTSTTLLRSAIAACLAAVHWWKAQKTSHDRCILGGTGSAAACCTNHRLAVVINCQKANALRSAGQGRHGGARVDGWVPPARRCAQVARRAGGSPPGHWCSRLASAPLPQPRAPQTWP